MQSIFLDSDKYEPLEIADRARVEEFRVELKAHQQGKTDFLTFIKMCATAGIGTWEICMEKMTCTYFDKAGNELLVEEIPLLNNRSHISYLEGHFYERDGGDNCHR